MVDSFPFVRITVLGSSGCGKTSLIHSFVNNLCLHDHQPTAFPTLYYRVVRLPPESDQRGIPTSVCIEIEDTVASGVAPAAGEEAAMMGQASGQPTTELKKVQRLRNVDFFFDMSRKQVVVPEGCTDFTPFSIWKPPKTPISMDRPVYLPLTQGRMGFIIVFDSNDQESFDTACQIHGMLTDHMEKQKVRVRPYIYFVATKIEKDPNSDTYKGIINLAEKYTQTNFVRLMKVSSLTAKNVKRTFWDLLYLITGNQILWEMEYEVRKEASSEEEEENVGASGCIQA